MKRSKDKPPSTLHVNAEDRAFGEYRVPSPKVRKTKSSKAYHKNLSGKIVKWTLIVAIWGLFSIGCLVVWYGRDLPDIQNIAAIKRRPSLTILASNGKKLATYGDLHGEMVTLNKLPKYLPQAILAIEDRRFYSHFGIDAMGLLRAMWRNYRSGHVVQGGSTITQQLAKNFLFSEKRYQTTDRSLKRKIQEAMLAIWLERKFSKDQILTIYLNRVYLGSGAFGVDAAARHYFAKKASQLNLYESAVIAGLLKAPTRYSPANNPERADQRAEQVLEAMVEIGVISASEKEASLVLVSSPPEAYQGSTVRYFCDWVIGLLDSYIGLDDKDLIITTTLDPQLQFIAENQMHKLINEYGKATNTSQLALLSMSPQGAIKAMLGGVNYKASKFNRATQALRQPGSVFKPVVYLTALENGFHRDDLISDMPIHLGKWRPKNYLYQSKGEITLQDALAYSVNTVTVRLAQQVGLKKIVNVARRLGIDSKLPDDLSVVLGTGESTLLELTSAYGVIASGGKRVWPFAILNIKDKDGKVIYEHEDSHQVQVFDPLFVTELHKMLEAVIDYGTGARAAIGPYPVAGKTGTSQQDRDSWFIGYHPALITGVWAGNDNNVSMKKISGGSLSTRLWQAFMKESQLYLSVIPETRQTVTDNTQSDTEIETPGILENLIDSILH